MGELRPISAPFVVSGPRGVAVRDRLRVSQEDEMVLRTVGVFLGSLASRDLKARCAAGHGHDKDVWAARKRELTAVSSSRWAGSISKAGNDQWALARRRLAAHVRSLEDGIEMLRRRLSLPVGTPGDRGAPGGYRSRREWFAKSRRLGALEDRLGKAQADLRAGRLRVVRGGKKLARARHHLDATGLSEAQWRERWEAARLFLHAHGEPGKLGGNETIRVMPNGEVSIRLPEYLAHLANAPHRRYTLSCTVAFACRAAEWLDRVTAGRAVAYTISFDPVRSRWHVTASWRLAPAPAVPLAAAMSDGCIGVDTNNDHLAAWRLDVHGNPIGGPRRFGYNLPGTTDHRDAQIRQAVTGLLHWARRHAVKAIAIEDLDFASEKTREKHGRRKPFRRMISGLPSARLRLRLAAMATNACITVVAVDPAYTSKWGAQHWQHPLTTPARKTTRHDAAAVVIGRRAQGHRARRRTAPPPHHQSDGAGHRVAQAAHGAAGRDGARPRTPGPRPGAVSPGAERKREPSPPKTVRDGRSDQGLTPAH